MKLELSEEDVKNTLVFLNRLSIPAEEATAFVVLRQKYVASLNEKPLPAPKKP